MLAIAAKSQSVSTRTSFKIDENTILFDGSTGNRMTYADFEKLMNEKVRVNTIPNYGYNGKPESFRVFVSTGSQVTTREPKEYNKGQIAPKFEFVNLNEEVIKSEELVGKYILINFLVNFNPPFFVPNQLENLNQLLNKYKLSDRLKTLVLVQATKLETQEFLKDKTLDFSFVPDATPFFDYFGIVHIPDFLLIDKAGKVVGKAEDLEELDVLLKTLK